MRIHKIILLIFICSSFISFTNKSTEEKGKTHKGSCLYNEKGQLRADTSLMIDSDLANYSRDCKFSSYLLDYISFPMFLVESGCFNNSMILKLSFRKDVSGSYLYKVTKVELLDAEGTCTDELFEINKKSLEGIKVETNYSLESFYVHIPIKFQIEIVDSDDYIPMMHKSMRDGYFMITVRNQRLINVD